MNQPSAAKHPKMDGQLATVADLAQRSGTDAAVAQARVSGLTVMGQSVRVVVEAAEGEATQVEPLLARAGGTIESRYETLTQALLPVTALEAVAASPAVQYVRAPMMAFPATSGGEPNPGGGNSTGCRP